MQAETFGQKLRRAREQACLSQRASAQLLTMAGFEVSDATVARIEGLPGAPKTASRRLLACMMLIAYGIDPAELELDIPAVLDARILVRRFAEYRKHLAWVTAAELEVEAA